VQHSFACYGDPVVYVCLDKCMRAEILVCRSRVHAVRLMASVWMQSTYKTEAHRHDGQTNGVLGAGLPCYTAPSHVHSELSATCAKPKHLFDTCATHHAICPVLPAAMACTAFVDGWCRQHYLVHCGQRDCMHHLCKLLPFSAAIATCVACPATGLPVQLYTCFSS